MQEDKIENMLSEICDKIINSGYVESLEWLDKRELFPELVDIVKKYLLTTNPRDFLLKLVNSGHVLRLETPQDVYKENNYIVMEVDVKEIKDMF